MSLEKIVEVDLIEVVQNGCIQVRTATKIVEDGTEISKSFHRHVIAPGQDYINESPRVIAICKAIHTPECVALYQAQIPKQG